MQIQENISLKPYNTFAIDASARYLSTFTTNTELQELLAFAAEKQTPAYILGGGSNILLTRNINGLAAINRLPGIEIVREDDNAVYVKAGAGENWHRFVEFCIGQNLAGVENLSLIPGSVGASPMQNIGAYGVELKDVFYQLEAYHKADKSIVTFSVGDCAFGYRESIFKNKHKGAFVITSVTFRLSKQPKFNTNYGAINTELEKMGVQDLTIAAVSQAVINIRKSKLPDPAQVGNAGSFFKNPTIAAEKFKILVERFPGVVGYTAGEDKIKIAAGWLIEQCGWKGYRLGDAGCHARQALVLVNYGKANGSEIWQLSEQIAQSVAQKFDIDLEREVNIL